MRKRTNFDAKSTWVHLTSHPSTHAAQHPRIAFLDAEKVMKGLAFNKVLFWSGGALTAHGR